MTSTPHYLHHGSWGPTTGPVGGACMAPKADGVMTLTCPCCLGSEDGHFSSNDPNENPMYCELCDGHGSIDVRLEW